MSDPTKVGQALTPEQAPAWLRPALVSCLAAYQWHNDLAVPAGSSVRFLTANPRRIGFVVWSDTAINPAALIAPFPDVLAFVATPPVRASFDSRDLGTDYSLVTAAWYAAHPTGTTIRVVEFCRPG